MSTTPPNVLNDHCFDNGRNSAEATDIEAAPDAASTGRNGCVATAVTDFDAAAYTLLEAFNTASQHSQHVLLNGFVSAAELYGMPFTIGAATLAQAVVAMSATTPADCPAPDGCLSAAADNLGVAGAAVIQAISGADPDTKHAISKSYQSLDLPHIDELGPLFAVAALAIAVKNLTQTDALGLTIEPSGGHQGW